MNQPHSYMDVNHGHMSNQSVSSSASAPSLTHYSSYPQHQPMQSSVPSYGSSPVGYPHYGGYSNGMQSMHSQSGSIGGQMVQQSPMSLPSNTPGGPPGPMQPSFDSTGQTAPHGMKPKVTATLWEDEGSLCFQVEAGGVCVARREDNHMINGTKLLNVAGMTRGRRDGILKSEKTRHVVKIGPMHLKGVWIPYERALEFANKEKITDQLYPLFVHNIGALLYHPTNSQNPRMPPTSQAPALQHHHSMSNSVGSHSSQAPHSAGPHPSSGRPGIDRAHTFPTPPTSASSVMGMGNAPSTYEWGGAPVQTSQPLQIDTSISNTRSVPTTPASTPPGNSLHAMSSYQGGGSYEHGRPMYGGPSQYSSQYGMNRYGHVQPSPGIKSEMAPPSRMGQEGEHGIESKPYQPHSQDRHPSSDNDHDHDDHYTHSAGPFAQNRPGYGYNQTTTPGMQHDQSQVSPEMAGSPNKGSGRATPRTTTTSYTGYNAPQRTQQLPSSNLYNVMSDNRNPTNGDMYASGYQQGFQSNNLPPSNKRVLDMDDDDEQSNGLKRSKTVHEDEHNRPRSMIAATQKKR